MEMPELPDENIFDILSRLPVKSLMRFKCVSKPWRSLISDPKFSKAHLFRQRKKSSKILFSTPRQAGILDYEDCQNSVVELNYPFAIRSGQRVEFVGSCDGLVCLLLNSYTCIVCNPSTRAFRILPHPISYTSYGYPDFFGIGYDSSIDDYKVVIGFWLYHFPDNDYSGDCEVHVLALKSNNWESTKFRIPPGFEGPSAHLNGNLHWVSKCTKPNEVIWSFNIKDEKFMEVVPGPVDFLPGSYRRELNYQIGLNVSENSLFLSALCTTVDADPIDTFYFQAWEKNMNTVENSWKKLYHLPLPIGFVQPRPARHCLLCFTTNHKLVLSFGENILRTYDVKAMTSKNFPVNSSPHSDGILYLETLVSPN